MSTPTDYLEHPWQVDHPITIGQSGSRIYRVSLPTGQTGILKITEPSNLPDYLTAGYPNVALSEYRFYTELAPALGLAVPKVLAHGNLPEEGTFLLLEDLSESHFIPPVEHIWSECEMKSILDYYAKMHGKAELYFAANNAPNWLHQNPRSTYTAEQAMASLEVLATCPLTAEAVRPIVASPHLEAMLRETEDALSHLPITLLHNDFYPPNVAIAKDGGQVLLLDWQLVGLGALHLDLVNIGFLRRSPAFARIDGDRLCDYYLERLGQTSARSFDKQAFLEDYHWANVLVWLDFLPRFARATTTQWDKWTADTFAICTHELLRSLQPRPRGRFSW